MAKSLRHWEEKERRFREAQPFIVNDDGTLRINVRYDGRCWAVYEAPALGFAYCVKDANHEGPHFHPAIRPWDDGGW
jgi:hypothetical protein